MGCVDIDKHNREAREHMRKLQAEMTHPKRAPQQAAVPVRTKAVNDAMHFAARKTIRGATIPIDAEFIDACLQHLAVATDYISALEQQSDTSGAQWQPIDGFELHTNACAFRPDGTLFAGAVAYEGGGPKDKALIDIRNGKWFRPKDGRVLVVTNPNRKLPM